jgi:hypothetical protein
MKKLVKDLLKSSLAFGTIGLREWSLFMGRGGGGGKWEGGGKRRFTVINRGGSKKFLNLNTMYRVLISIITTNIDSQIIMPKR